MMWGLSSPTPVQLAAFLFVSCSITSPSSGFAPPTSQLLLRPISSTTLSTPTKLNNIYDDWSTDLLSTASSPYTKVAQLRPTLLRRTIAIASTSCICLGFFHSSFIKCSLIFHKKSLGRLVNVAQRNDDACAKLISGTFVPVDWRVLLVLYTINGGADEYSLARRLGFFRKDDYYAFLVGTGLVSYTCTVNPVTTEREKMEKVQINIDEWNNLMIEYKSNEV